MQENNDIRLIMFRFLTDVFHSLQAGTTVSLTRLVYYRRSGPLGYHSRLVGAVVVADNDLPNQFLRDVGQYQTNAFFFVISRYDDVDDRFFQRICLFRMC